MQYYTLDESSKILGLKPEEFRKRLATQWKNLRRFPDGATLRFQARDIDELARTLGRSSEVDLKLGEAPVGLAEEPAPAVAKKADETIFVPPPSSDEFIPLAVDDPSNTQAKTGKSGSDSDVKLEKTAGGTVRAVPQKDDDATELLEIPAAAEKVDRTPFQVKSDAPRKRPPVTSEFELSLNTDSDDFDLALTDDSDEVPIGTVTRKGPRSGDSGINLEEPADSGISLEKNAPYEAAAKSGPDTGSLKDDSDSEFELTLDDSGSSEIAATAFDSGEQKDIFETDFELPAIDDSSSEDKSGASDENSDFDLSADDSGSEDESASEVVAIEEEAEDELKPVDDEDEAPTPVRQVPTKPAEWGALPVAFMLPCVVVMFFVGLMGFELVRSMWGYHTGTKVTGPIVDTVSGLFK